MSSHDPLDLQKQAKVRAESQRALKAVLQREEDDIVWLMEDARGRRVVRRLLDQSRMHHSSWSSNALEMSRNEGRREFGVALLALVERACPDAYVQMLQERWKDETPGS